MGRENKGKHIGLVIHGITQGGAERIMSGMANYWVQNGVDVTLFSLDQLLEVDEAYGVHENVNRVRLPWCIDGKGIWGEISKIFKRISAIRRGFREHRPDVIIAFMPQVNILSIIAARLEEIPIIISERNNPKRDPLSISWRLLRFFVYPLANKLVVQTHRIRKMFPWLGGRKCVVVPNFVRDIGSCKTLREQKRENVIVAVGRLTEAKGFDVLIRAFAQIKGQFPSWRVEIWGKGKEQLSLQTLIEEQGCADCVRLMGSSPQIEEHMKAASVFVLSSRYEGFPNVLCEAMACGLAVVSTDCISGPAEIIEHGVNGMLVPVDDESVLATTIAQLLQDAALRESLGEKALAIRRTYHVSEIMKMWNTVVNEVL